MKKVYIVVEDGLVQSVYADDGKVEVVLIDFDTEDHNEYEDNLKVVEEVRKTAYQIY
jgi:hypothetical protein